MFNLADIIASPYISYIVAAIGVAIIMNSRGSKKLLLVGLWLVADFMCDYLVTGFSEYWSYGDSTSYYYLYASTAVMFAYHASKNQKSYGIIIPYVLTAIAITSVAFCIYRYELISNWNQWGELLYNDIGSMIDGIYLFFIVALEALMVIIGFNDDTLTRANARRINI